MTMNVTVWQSPVFRSMLSACAGFIAYGLWAYYANYEHGHTPALMSACVQGSFSFTITLVINSVMELLYRRVRRCAFPKLVTATVACLMLYAASAGINYLAGTINIIKTILPGAIASTVYIVMYVQTLAVLDQQARATNQAVTTDKE